MVHKPTEYDSNLWKELMTLGCVWDPGKEQFSCPDAKKPNINESLNFYSGRAKNMTPFQKKVKLALEKELPLDVVIRKDGKGFWVVNTNDLFTKKQLQELTKKIGIGIKRCMNGRRYLMDLEKGHGKLW